MSRFQSQMAGPDEEGPALPYRHPNDEAELDITPMIDMTFLLLIFFLVTSIPDNQREVELPRAEYGKGITTETAVIITLAEREGNRAAAIYLADGKVGSPLPDDVDQQDRQILGAIEQGARAGKTAVLVKAEKGVHHSEVSRVASAVGEVEGMQLFLAVTEE